MADEQTATNKPGFSICVNTTAAPEKCDHRQTVARDGHIYCADCGLDVIGTGLPGGKERHQEAEPIKIIDRSFDDFAGAEPATCQKCGRQDCYDLEICLHSRLMDAERKLSAVTAERNNALAAMDNLLRKIRGIKADRDRLRGLLEKYQWGNGSCCPECDNVLHHTLDCEIGKALVEVKK